jgi:hypothetical protein
MLLSDPTLRKAKQQDKPYRLTDGDGLYLLVQPNGKKWWRFDYRHQGTRKTLSFGTYPEVTLASAREKRAEARALVAAGTDPSAKRQAEKEAGSENTFKAIAIEFMAANKDRWSPSHYKHIAECFDRCATMA